MGHLMGAWVKAIGICPIGNNVAIVVGLGRFLPRDAMLARYMLSSCPSQAGIVLYRNDWTNRAGFFCMDASTYPALCCKEIWVSPKISVGYF